MQTIAQPSPPKAAGPAPEAPLDETADSAPDTAALMADAFSRHIEYALVAQQTRQQEAQIKLDQMKTEFNDSEQERAELIREMNALRDMALEQAKKDDEVLKKYIAMI
jgi:hypothetical protein